MSQFVWIALLAACIWLFILFRSRNRPKNKDQLMDQIFSKFYVLLKKEIKKDPKFDGFSQEIEDKIKEIVHPKVKANINLFSSRGEADSFSKEMEGIGLMNMRGYTRDLEKVLNRPDMQFVIGAFNNFKSGIISREDFMSTFKKQLEEMEKSHN